MATYRNPVLPGCHPDPGVCRFGDEFVLVTSSFEYLPGLPVHVSSDLIGWRQVGHAIERPGQLDLAGLESSRGLFAPSVRVVGERLVVVCTVVGPDDGSWGGRTGHFAVTATDARGPWSDPVWIDGVGGIDPCLTVDGERLWLTGTQPAASASYPGQTDVWLVELDPSTLQPLGSPTVIWGGAMKGAVWAEGPRILSRPGGGWLLLTAEGGTAEDHAVVVAYSDEITGTYVGDPGNPRLTHRELGRRAEFSAVGHADLVQDATGAWWATLLATRPVPGLSGGAREGLLGRETCLVPVEWEDGRPLFAPGVGRVQREVVTGGEDSAPVAHPLVVEGFGEGALDLDWNGVGRHPSAFADLLEGGGVRLRGGGEPSEVVPRSLLGRRLPAERAHVAVTIGVPAGSGVRGGLLLRVSELAVLELSVDGAGTVSCVRVTPGERVVLASGSARDVGAVRLELSVDGLSGRASVDGDLFASVDLAGLAPSPGRDFVGAWVGPVAVGPSSEVVTASSFVLAVRA
ncbi:glycoside hydrolase family 43 protein [Herbiconiux sp. VKM Ac-1786]|uniref:glycoside hydrolase family 43 protein n=1 Tax=Herbiconiux sp. VKM Ac-1786 TaxID=2783824 RepID=UPI00188C3F24|nr:glycoside hydrolase family 43 protein [Herbiconiux sp. VKM Ac-1786]MBF4574239.1 glycoside hydrolase family 43 protein [Herbiconiux sp. VKM Ac-1786]